MSERKQMSDAEYQSKYKFLTTNIIQFIMKNPQFNIHNIKLHHKKTNPPFTIINDSQYLFHHTGDAILKKLKTIHQDGSYKVYTYDPKNGVYMNKKKTQIVVSLSAFSLLMQKKDDLCDLDPDIIKHLGLLNNSVVGNFVFDRMRSNHTGNHYRNDNIYVPKSVYGMK